MSAAGAAPTLSRTALMRDLSGGRSPAFTAGLTFTAGLAFTALTTAFLGAAFAFTALATAFLGAAFLGAAFLAGFAGFAAFFAGAVFGAETGAANAVFEMPP